MFKTSKTLRLVSALLLSIVVMALLVACGDNTATSSTSTGATAAGTTAASTSTTLAAATAAAMTSVAATTAPAMTSVAAKTSAVATTAAVATTSAAATTASGTTAAGATSAAATTAASGTLGGGAVPASGATAKISLSEVKLGVIPAENATKVFDDTKPFAKAMSDYLGVPVKIFVGTNYTATIEALASGKIDVAWFGPFSYVLSADKYNGEAILLQLGTKGETSYNSFIITSAKNTNIATLADLKGKSFSFVDAASTSGNLVPRYTMLKAGLDPDKDVKGVFAGGHDASLLGVIGGKTDAGAVASDVYSRLVSEGKVSESDVKIIAKSDPIPNSPIAVRKELSAGDKSAIRAAFLSVKDPAALKAVNTAGFQETSNATYDGLRDIAKILNLDLTKLK